MTQAELRDFMAQHFDDLSWNRNRRLPRELPLDIAARRMTAIIQTALDKFPPAERARRLKAYLAKTPRRFT